MSTLRRQDAAVAAGHDDVFAWLIDQVPSAVFVGRSAESIESSRAALTLNASELELHRASGSATLSASPAKAGLSLQLAATLQQPESGDLQAARVP